MNRTFAIASFVVSAACSLVSAQGQAPAASGKPPSFSLAWSEYPSWSVFGVASDRGLINGELGKQGPLEKKYNIDIELKQADYDPCLTMYGAGAVDAVCITNMDALSPALGRRSVLVLPTSTSDGGDALVAVGVKKIQELKKPKAVYGLSKSVSEYAFVRGLLKLGENPADYEFKNMDPAAAATSLQTKAGGIDAIMVWNPFVLQTLQARSDSRVILDSTLIPGEIVDSVVIAKDSLDKPGGEAFVLALAEAFYAVNAMMADPKKADETYVALGAKFSNLDAASMRKVCTQTKFYSDPSQAVALAVSPEFKKTMEIVVEFCVKNEIVIKTPVVGFGPHATTKGDLVIDTSIIAKLIKPAPAAPAKPAAPAAK